MKVQQIKLKEGYLKLQKETISLNEYVYFVKDVLTHQLYLILNEGQSDNQLIEEMDYLRATKPFDIRTLFPEMKLDRVIEGRSLLIPNIWILIHRFLHSVSKTAIVMRVRRLIEVLRMEEGREKKWAFDYVLIEM